MYMPMQNNSHFYKGIIAELSGVKDQLYSDLIQQIFVNQWLLQAKTSEQIQSDQVKVYEGYESSSTNSATNFICEQLRQARTEKRIRKCKNDTKNVPKNFGKAIISFVEQNELLVRKFLQVNSVEYYNFLKVLRMKKKSLSTISQLRSLWLDSQFPYAKQMRIISNYFLRKVGLSYIFQSKILNIKGHMIYKNRLVKGLQNPEQFTWIKE